MGDYLTGLVQGFSQRKGEHEKFNLEQGIAARERESKIFEHLLSSPDPEVRAMAATGLLDSAQPGKKKSGLAGWMGEIQSSPMLGQIRALMNTEVPTEVTQQGADTLPSGQFSGGSPLPSVQPSMTEAPEQAGSAAMPTTSAITGGPPPTPTTYSSSPPRPTFSTKTEMRPRQVFLSPGEQYRQDAIAKAGADVEGDIAAYTPYLGRQGAIDEVMKERTLRGRAGAGGVAGQSYAEGNIIKDPASPTGWSQQLYLRADPSQVRTIPAQPPNTPEYMAEKAGATTTARGKAGAEVPLNTGQRFEATTKLSNEWAKVNTSHREMQRQYQLMQTGLKRFAEGDKIGGSQAVLVTFQKILDPTSVVRESEYARSPQGLSLVARLEGFMQRLTEGGAGVPQEELGAMVETARQFTEDMQHWNDAEQQRITKQAADYGIDPRHIFGTLGNGTGTPNPTAGPPTPVATSAPAGPPPVPSFTPQAITPMSSHPSTATPPVSKAISKKRADGTTEWYIQH